MVAGEQQPAPSRSGAFPLAGLLIGIAAATPSIAWGLAGADFLSDDFVVAAGLARNGVLRGLWNVAFVAPVRPAAGPYYVLLYEVVGDHPLIQVLLLGAVNALAAILVWQALSCLVRANTATVAALVFALVPNRGSTRFWFVTGSNVLALACVAGGTVLLLRKGRVPHALGLFVVAVLTYEGTALMALVVVGWWWVQDRKLRVRGAVVGLTLIGAATLSLFAFSPKRDVDGPGPFEHTDTLGSGVFGSGFWGNELVGTVGSVVVLVVITLALTTWLPSFRREGDEQISHEVRIGVVLVGAAVLPFLVGGAPFAVRGIFDRNNLIPDIGASVIVATLMTGLVRRHRVAGVIAATVVLGFLAAGNIQDVRDYRAAVTDGHALLTALVADVDPSEGTVVVVPALPGENGVEQFILGGDLTSALQLRHGPGWESVSMPEDVGACRALVRRRIDEGSAVHVYDRLERTLTLAYDVHACDGA